MLKLGTKLGLFLVVVVALFFASLFFRGAPRAPAWVGQKAQLPCLADNHCPMEQKCSNGYCSEGFTSPLDANTGVNANVNISVDGASCDAKECKGLNATCGRKQSPCGEGTFCQNDSCVNVTAPSEGEAYGQIGMILN